MSFPLIDRLTGELGYALLTDDNYDSFTKENDTVVLFFTEDASRFPESLDVAVVLPELVASFSGQFVPAVIDRSIEKKLQKKFDFKVWPALVFLKQGKYLGTLTRILDWSDYATEIPTILQTTPSRNPGLGIRVVTEQRTQA